MCLVNLCKKKYRKNKTENETGYLQGRDGNWGEKGRHGNGVEGMRRDISLTLFFNS